DGDGRPGADRRRGPGPQVTARVGRFRAQDQDGPPPRLLVGAGEGAGERELPAGSGPGRGFPAGGQERDGDQGGSQGTGDDGGGAADPRLRVGHERLLVGTGKPGPAAAETGPGGQVRWEP